MSPLSNLICINNTLLNMFVFWDRLTFYIYIYIFICTVLRENMFFLNQQLFFVYFIYIYIYTQASVLIYIYIYTYKYSTYTHIIIIDIYTHFVLYIVIGFQLEKHFFGLVYI